MSGELKVQSSKFKVLSADSQVNPNARSVFVKPVLTILTLPITILTLGLFNLVINAGLILVVAAIVPGFSVDGFWWALVFSLVLSIVNSFLHQVESKAS